MNINFTLLNPSFGVRILEIHPIFAYWAALDYWSADEAASLSIRVDPRFTFDPRKKGAVDDLDGLRKRLERIAFPNKGETILREFVLASGKTVFERLRERIKRAIGAGRLGDQIVPNRYLVWADENGISVPDELKAAVEARSEVPNWKVRCDDLSQQYDAVVKQRDELLRELDKLRKRESEASLKTRERRTAYKMIVGICARQGVARPQLCCKECAGGPFGCRRAHRK
jgi:hypothetical protein